MADEKQVDPDWTRGILRGLQSKRHMYEGTVPPAEVEKRRAKNKAARKARKQQRRG